MEYNKFVESGSWGWHGEDDSFCRWDDWPSIHKRNRQDDGVNLNLEPHLDDYIFRMLTAIGLPAAFVRAVRSLYGGNAHWLAGQASAAPAFVSGAGVKQGCPLSPTIYLLVSDAVTRAVRAAIGPGDSVRGFADDLAVVMRRA